MYEKDAYKTFSIFKASQCKLPSPSSDVDHFHTCTASNSQQHIK